MAKYRIVKTGDEMYLRELWDAPRILLHYYKLEKNTVLGWQFVDGVYAEHDYDAQVKLLKNMSPPKIIATFEA